MKTHLQKSKLLLTTLLAIISISSCNIEDVNPDTRENLSFDDLSLRKSHGKVIHSVTLGGADVCEFFGKPKGCNRNLSLIANMYEDGTVKGQWHDNFATKGEAIHVEIDCAEFGTVGDFKWAKVGGVITKGIFNEEDVTGRYAVMLLVDNYQGEDQISLFTNPSSVDCSVFPFPLYRWYPVDAGQVRIR